MPRGDWPIVHKPCNGTETFVRIDGFWVMAWCRPCDSHFIVDEAPDELKGD